MSFLKQIRAYMPAFIFIVLITGGCTKDFQDLNTNPTALTDEQINADFTLISAFLQQAQRAIIPQDVGTYQLAENLSSDVYSGYMGAEAPFIANSNNMTYNLVDGWNQSIWTYRYANVMNPTYKVIALAEKDPSLKDLDAFARIIRVSAMSRVSEKIGPIIYSQYNKLDANNNVPYDKQEDLYPLFFNDLETAITTLKGLKGSPVSSQMKKADLAYAANNYDNWLRYANTLRLRLALRLAYVDPALARNEGEKALDPANGGFLEDNNQNCFIALSVTHPLNTIGYDWSDIRMGAEMESFLTGYNDPRVSKYFKPAEDANPEVFGKYKGIRSGIEIDSKSRYDSYSRLVAFSQDKMQIMVAAESWFLRAEAALRGWKNAGDPKENYDNGISRSFEMYGLSAASYKNDATSKPKPYIDPNSVVPGANDVLTGSPYLSTITIKWEDSDDNNRKLERIITQKWIALFPDGEEAWTEYRRTGYPILFPVVVNKSAGAIPTIPGVRRIPIPIREFNTNTGAAEEAAASLGGPNTGATRLRWDVEDKSFK